MDKVKVAVIGVGYLGRFHAEKYAKSQQARLVGVVDIIPSRAEEVARAFQTQPFYCHEEILDKVQAVSIAVPTPAHYAIAKDFLEEGVDVLLEKPMTVTLEEAEELVALAEKKSLVLQIGHLERFNSAILALEGTLKDPMFIESHRLSPFQGRGIEVDVVLDLMIHDIDIILSMVPAQVNQLQAVGVPVISKTVDIANARLTFANGCVANVTASRVSRETVRKMRIFQPDAYISIDYAAQQINIFRREQRGPGENFPRIVEQKLDIAKSDSLEKEIEAFLEAVKKRSTAPISGREGKRALEVALHIEEEIASFARAHWNGLPLEVR